MPAPQNDVRHSPVTGGLAISAATHSTNGTVGAFVQLGGVNYLLTNHHVAFGDSEEQRQVDENLRLVLMRASNKVSQPQFGLEDLVAIGVGQKPIFHPPFIGATNSASRVVAHAQPTLADATLDAALCPLNGGVHMSFYVRGDPAYLIAGVEAPVLNQIVKKSGAATGVTYGQVKAIRGDVFIIEAIRPPVTGHRGTVFTVEPLWQGAIALHGDSGAVWVDAETNNAVGLLTSGKYLPDEGKNYSVATRMDSLVTRFGFAFTRL